MRNIFLVPTAEKSQLYKINDKLLFEEYPVKTISSGNLFIYITNNQKIKGGDWIMPIDGIPYKLKEISGLLDSDKKIFTTNDTTLIADGVKEIQIEFLKWFVKNPSCEFAEYHSNYNRGNGKHYYKIIIPKEEPKNTGNIIVDYAIANSNTIQNSMHLDAKIAYDLLPKQETFIDVAERLVKQHPDFEAEGMSEYQNGRFNGIIEGLEYANKQNFTAEETELIANEMVNLALDNVGNKNPESGKKFDEVLSKYKKHKY